MANEIHVSDLAAGPDFFYATSGDKAPLFFTIDTISDGKLTKVNLNDYLGKWVLLFFYPSDFTFIWPTELAAVAAVHKELNSLNTQVLAISTDSIFSHKVFLETSPSLKEVRYPLLSDRSQEISKAYRVLDAKSGASFRASFFIDPDQIIRAKFIYPHEVGRNLDEHIRILKGIQYAQKTGQGIPANWKPGEPGIIRDPKKIGKI